MINRMVRVLQNDLTLWPELKKDPEASSQGYLVILLIAAGSALTGTFIGGSLGDIFLLFPINLVRTLAGYVIVLVIAYFLSNGGSADSTFDQLRTALAYGYTPTILAGIPLIGILFGLWTLVTISSAIRETMGISKGMTYYIVILSIVVNFVIIGIMVTTLIGLFDTTQL